MSTISQEQFQELMQQLERKLADEGKLIEAGWVTLRAMWLRPDTPEFQVNDLRMAFMAGAQHLFGSMMGILDPGAEPTDADLDRMSKIDIELKMFYAELEARFGRHRRQ